MSGFLCASIAAFVSGGIASRPVHSTGSPDLAAQPAAGIANSGRSAEATTTERDGFLAAAACRRSIARAVAAELPALTSVVFRPSGLATSPIRIDLGAARLLGAGRLELLERVRGRLGELVALGEQHGRAQRRRRRAGRRRCPRASRPGRRARPRSGACRRRARGTRPGRRRPRWRPGRRPPRASCSWSRRPGSRGPGRRAPRRRAGRARAGPDRRAAADVASSRRPLRRTGGDEERDEQQRGQQASHVARTLARCPFGHAKFKLFSRPPIRGRSGRAHGE